MLFLQELHESKPTNEECSLATVLHQVRPDDLTFILNTYGVDDLRDDGADEWKRVAREVSAVMATEDYKEFTTLCNFLWLKVFGPSDKKKAHRLAARAKAALKARLTIRTFCWFAAGAMTGIAGCWIGMPLISSAF